MSTEPATVIQNGQERPVKSKRRKVGLRSLKPKSNSYLFNSPVFKNVLINAQKMEYVKMVHANVTQIGQVKIAH